MKHKTRLKTIINFMNWKQKKLKAINPQWKYFTTRDKDAINNMSNLEIKGIYNELKNVVNVGYSDIDICPFCIASGICCDKCLYHEKCCDKFSQYNEFKSICGKIDTDKFYIKIYIKKYFK